MRNFPILRRHFPSTYHAKYSEYHLQNAIRILTLHSNGKRPKSHRNQLESALSSLLRRNRDVLSAIFQWPFGDIPMASRRYSIVLSAIFQGLLGDMSKQNRCIIGHYIYNTLIFKSLLTHLKSAYFRPTTVLMIKSRFSEAV